MHSIAGHSMLFIQRIAIALVAAGLVTVVAACSGDEEEGGSSKQQGPAAACEHLNDVCASTDGFRKQDCSSTNASYATLSESDKERTDAIVPCVMAAKSCQPALDCIRGGSSGSSGSGANDQTTRATDAQAACERINAVCDGQSGFRTQDCSSSNASYAKLSPEEKQTADAIAPCIMKASTCEAAFGCLRQLTE